MQQQKGQLLVLISFITMASTREKIVGLAQEYIQAIGYPSFAYKQIGKALSIKNASIHYHFPTKDDLGLAVIEQAKTNFDQAAASWASLSPPARLQALMGVYRQYQQDGGKLCIVGSFGACYQDLSPALRAATDSHVAQIATWLTATFEEGQRTGLFTFTEPVEALTAGWMSTLIGSLSLGRMHGPNYFEQTLSSLQQRVT